MVYSLLSCPPNYLWQAFLEATFPGYTHPAESGTTTSIVQDSKVQSLSEKAAPTLNSINDRANAASSAISDNGLNQNIERRAADGREPVKTKGEGDHTPAEHKKKVSKKLNIKNTGIKFALDQTLGAAANTVMFIAGISMLRGQSSSQIIANVQEEFFPLLSAGQKLWPAVSIISFTLVPVERRTVFGGIVGVGWGVFLSLVTGAKK